MTEAAAPVDLAAGTRLGPYQILEELAAVEARNGDAEAALDVLTILVAIPCRISPQLLRIDPQWNRLHGNPRFQQLIRTSP